MQTDPIYTLTVPNEPAPDAAGALQPSSAGPLEDDEDEGACRPLTPERRLLCMIVRQLTEELLRATGLEAERDGSRRALSHVRQIAMYVCHIAYSMPMDEVAQAFGRDRSTVGHACRMVEDRRDDQAYDLFVSIVERMATAIVLLAGKRP